MNLLIAPYCIHGDLTGLAHAQVNPSVPGVARTNPSCMSGVLQIEVGVFSGALRMELCRGSSDPASHTRTFPDYTYNF